MAHTPCPGLGVGFLRRAVGVRLRPGEGRDFGNEAGAGGCASLALAVSVEPKMPVSSEGGKWEIRTQDSGSFHCWAVLSRPQPASKQVYSLTLGQGVRGSTCSLLREN